jgi:hypothetical protein
MASSPASSDLSDPPSAESDIDDHAATPAPSSRPSVDITNAEAEPPSKRRKTGPSTLVTLEAATPHPEDDDDSISLSSDGWSSAPGSPNDDEWALREQAQTGCLWRDCNFGHAENNDDLVRHVQGTHCATAGPKKTKYVCEWGECQRKTSNHPSGYALKAHMRSHTKEKPYYCSLPGKREIPMFAQGRVVTNLRCTECDKAFTRSDALAKHMRTVHEPEFVKIGTEVTTITTGKGKAAKIKLTNGNSKPPADTGPTHDEDGNEVDPSPPNDNITYIPAHHPITGQPGFMIHYPPDVHFSAWESSIPADQLMRLLRRQVHWAQQESEELKREIEMLEQQKKEEWTLKEILLEGAMEAELAQADRDNVFQEVDARVREAMEKDVQPAKRLHWTGGAPPWRSRPVPLRTMTSGDGDEDDASDRPHAQESPSPPPTGMSGGFDGEADPYDNYLAGRMAEYEERERLRSMQNTPAKATQEQKAAEADAVGALVGMSGK